MQSELQQRAVSFLELKKLQRKLAVTGAYADAITLGEKIDPHAVTVALEYLKVKELPEGINSVLVREISVEAASLSSKKSVLVSKLRSVLRRAAWSKNASTTEKLEKAKAALPDLRKVVAELR